MRIVTLRETLLYDMLGVSRNASTDTIEQAFYQLKGKYPVTEKMTAEAMCRIIELNVAYTVLSDKRNRALYDNEMLSFKRKKI